jgi:hypothetical protein
MELRPHHLLDILRDYGLGSKFEPSPYGHAVHTVAQDILADTSITVKFVVGADEICRPCKHLQPNGKCNDVLRLSPPVSKQQYNDELDRQLLEYLELPEDMVITVREYFELVNRHTPGIEEICTHPREDRKRRLAGLIQGLEKVGIRR